MHIRFKIYLRFLDVREPTDAHLQEDVFATKLRDAGLKTITILPFIGLLRWLSGKESTCTLRDGMEGR